MMAPMLLAEKINTYYGQSHILRGVDFRVMPRETVSLLGRNGMGKTTLLRSLVGLVKPRTGRVMLNGADITGNRPSFAARAGLAFIPEDRGIFPNLTVIENLTFAARPGRGTRPDWTLERIYSLFPRLAERRGQLAGTMSGGEQAMVSIGRGLMRAPKLLLIDEPSLGLAPILVQENFKIIRRINEQGITIFLV